MAATTATIGLSTADTVEFYECTSMIAAMDKAISGVGTVRGNLGAV